MYCLDTNVIIDVFRKKISLSEKLESITEVSVTSIVACELYKGAYLSKNAEKSMEQIKYFLSKTTFLTVDEGVCRIFGELYSFMSKKGKLTEENDLLIAAICIRNNATLITSNKRHFEHVPGLVVEYV